MSEIPLTKDWVVLDDGNILFEKSIITDEKPEYCGIKKFSLHTPSWGICRLMDGHKGTHVWSEY